jgi:MFS family permease
MTLFFVDEVCRCPNNLALCSHTLQTLGKDKTESATSNTVPLSAWQLIKYPGVWQMILIFNYAGLLAITHAVVNPIFLYTPIRLGGIGFSPELIAASIGISGISQALWLLVFPKLHKRFGTRQILYCTAIAWPIFFMLHPGFHLLLRYKLDILFWSLAPPALVLGSGIAISFTTIQLLINEIAPPDTLATLNGVVLGFSSGIGAFVPALATSLYAIGVGNHVFGGQLFWLINILLSFGFLGVLRLLPREAKSVPNGEA